MAKMKITCVREYHDFDDGGSYSVVVFGDKYSLVSVEHIKQNVYLVNVEKDGDERSFSLSAEHPIIAEKVLLSRPGKRS